MQNIKINKLYIKTLFKQRFLTHTTVIHRGIVNPALGLLYLPLHIYSCFHRAAVGNGTIHLGLQILQRSSYLLR